MLKFIPNLYDIFYFNFKIVEQFSDVKKIRKEFQKNNASFEKEYYGLLYFLELIIIQTSYQLELLIADPDLLDRIRWGNDDPNNQEYKKFLSSNQEASLIAQLNSFLRKLSVLREKFDENDLQAELSDLNRLFLEIDRSLKKKHSIKAKKTFRINESLVIFDHILRDFHWFKFGVVNPKDAFDIDKEVPLHPGYILSYTLSDKKRSGYFLQDYRIKNHNSAYFNGYKTTLLILYCHFIPEYKIFFRRLFDGCSDWTGLQLYYGQIIDEMNLKPDLIRQLFDVKESVKMSEEIPDEVNNIEKLKEVLRNREIRCFKDFYQDWALIAQYLFGAVEQSNENLRAILEIIQFDIINPKKSKKLAYYAIFNPTRGASWDASYWILFRSPYGWGDPDEMQRIIIEIQKKSIEPIRFRKTKISENLIKEYYLLKDELAQKENQSREIIKSCRGLLGEFLTQFYLIKKYDIKQIIDVECHIEDHNTDIDALIETEEKIIIAQVKSFFYFNPEETKKVRDYFKHVTKHYQLKNKTILKILIFMDWKIHESEIEFLLNEKFCEMNEGFCVDSDDIEDKRQQITNEFTKEQIEIVYRKDIQDYFKTDRKYASLLDTLNKIFPNPKDVD